MTSPRLFPVLVLSLLGCSESPESAVDQIAGKSKELIGTAREMAADVSDNVKGELAEVKETASDKVAESIDQFDE